MLRGDAGGRAQQSHDIRESAPSYTNLNGCNSFVSQNRTCYYCYCSTVQHRTVHVSTTTCGDHGTTVEQGSYYAAFRCPIASGGERPAMSRGCILRANRAHPKRDSSFSQRLQAASTMLAAVPAIPQASRAEQQQGQAAQKKEADSLVSRGTAAGVKLIPVRHLMRIRAPTTNPQAIGLRALLRNH